MKPNFRWKMDCPRTMEEEAEAGSRRRMGSSATKDQETYDCSSPSLSTPSPLREFSEEMSKDHMCLHNTKFEIQRTRKSSWSRTRRESWRPEWRISLGFMLMLCILSRVTMGALEASPRGDVGSFSGEDTLFAARRLSSVTEPDSIVNNNDGPVFIYEPTTKRVKTTERTTEGPCGGGRGHQVKIKYSSSIVENGNIFCGFLECISNFNGGYNANCFSFIILKNVYICLAS